jgi:hypothetical protein
MLEQILKIVNEEATRIWNEVECSKTVYKKKIESNGLTVELFYNLENELPNMAFDVNCKGKTISWADESFSLKEFKTTFKEFMERSYKEYPECFKTTLKESSMFTQVDYLLG